MGIAVNFDLFVGVGLRIGKKRIYRVKGRAITQKCFGRKWVKEGTAGGFSLTY